MMTSSDKLRMELEFLRLAAAGLHSMLMVRVSEDKEFEREYLRTILEQTLAFMKENDADDNNKPSPEGE